MVTKSEMLMESNYRQVLYIHVYTIPAMTVTPQAVICCGNFYLGGGT